MRKVSNEIFACIFILFTLSTFTGCSILGYNIGEVLDNKKPDYEHSKIPGLNAMYTPLGLQTRENFNRLNTQKVYITLTNNQSFSSWFAAVERKDSVDYIVIQAKNKESSIAFSDILCIQTAREKLAIQNSDLIILTKQGEKVLGKFQFVNMAKNQVYLVLEADGIKQVIACKDIAHIQSKRRKNGEKTGFLVGLVFDVAAFAALSTIDVDLDWDVPILTGSWAK